MSVHGYRYVLSYVSSVLFHHAVSRVGVLAMNYLFLCLIICNCKFATPKQTTLMYLAALKLKSTFSSYGTISLCL